MFTCAKCKREFKNNGGFVRHTESCKFSDELISKIVDEYCNQNYSLRDLEKKYSINKSRFLPFLKNKTRNTSESIKIAHINKPEVFRHSESTKLKLRDIRLKWMKENPEKTAWRQSNLSYPEKVFLNKILELQLDKKYLIIREKSVFPYFIDFAFENEKIAVEIDGSQHLIDERKEMDLKKDLLLKNLGWSVYRIPAFEVQRNVDGIIEKLLNVLGGGSLENNGFFLDKTEKQIKLEEEIDRKNQERVINGGITNYELDSHISQRKVSRPPYELLIKDVIELGYVGTGKKYGVTDNAIRKWKKYYEKYIN
jgi:very-short-patch-repair endonuclease/transposase-like protein